MQVGYFQFARSLSAILTSILPSLMTLNPNIVTKQNKQKTTNQPTNKTKTNRSNILVTSLTKKKKKS